MSCRVRTRAEPVMSPQMAWNWKYDCLCLQAIKSFPLAFTLTPTRENTSRRSCSCCCCCTHNTGPNVHHTPRHRSEPPLCASLCVCVSVSARRLAAPEIAYAPNYGCKHRCGKPGLPPPKSQTHRPAHSALCVPVWEHRKSRC